MPIGEEICYLNDDWINVFDVVLVDSKNDTKAKIGEMAGSE